MLAHEVTHLKRRDALYNGWWIALTGVIIWIMRRREYMVDNRAALLTGKAKPLITALKQMEAQDCALLRHSALSMLFTFPNFTMWNVFREPLTPLTHHPYAYTIKQNAFRNTE